MQPFLISLSLWDLPISAAFLKTRTKRWKVSWKINNGKKPLRKKCGDPASEPYPLSARNASAHPHTGAIRRFGSARIGPGGSGGGRSFDQRDRTRVSRRKQPQNARDF